MKSWFKLRRRPLLIIGVSVAILLVVLFTTWFPVYGPVGMYRIRLDPKLTKKADRDAVDLANIVRFQFDRFGGYENLAVADGQVQVLARGRWHMFGSTVIVDSNNVEVTYVDGPMPILTSYGHQIMRFHYSFRDGSLEGEGPKFGKDDACGCNLVWTPEPAPTAKESTLPFGYRPPGD